MSIFKLPDLGEGLPDAEINEWYVKEGDEVEVDQPLVSMETAKAVVDVPSPQKGRIAKLHGKPGDIIKTGAPLIEFEGETATTSVQNDTGTVVGNIVVGNKSVADTAIVGSAGSSTASVTQVKATPAVRALAQRLKVDIAQIVGTGPQGLITAEDVQNALQKNAPSNIAQAKPSSAIPQDYEPVRGVRRSMAMNMAKSHAEVVPVTIVDDANISAWPQGTDITVCVIRALIAACHAEPALNAWYDHESSSRRIFNNAVHLGIAMDSEDGLFVPVIHETQQQNDEQLRQQVNQFKQQVKARNISPDALKDCTIMLSNFGTFAGRYASPIIVPPIVAIIATGKIREEVFAVNGEIKAGRIMPLSLTFDHRAVTGGEAARFLKAMIDHLQIS